MSERPHRVDAVYVDQAFQYHAPTGDQAQRYQRINEQSRDLATVILIDCPESPERTLAIRALQEARMWANASIAINGV